MQHSENSDQAALEQGKKNIRLAIMLALIALMFYVGYFLVKM